MRAAGLSERITIRHADASEGLSGRYDLVTTFDVVHDAVNPRGMLRSIHDALPPDGTYLCLEITCALSRSRTRVQLVRSSRDAAYCCA